MSGKVSLEASLSAGLQKTKYWVVPNTILKKKKNAFAIVWSENNHEHKTKYAFAIVWSEKKTHLLLFGLTTILKKKHKLLLFSLKTKHNMHLLLFGLKKIL
jgi:hypothetical protein